MIKNMNIDKPKIKLNKYHLIYMDLAMKLK